MANDLLDPLKQDESGSEPDFNSEKNVSQDHYDKTFNDITSSPENQAFGDQMESLAGDNGNNEFSYSPDAERRNLADQESKGSADANTTPPPR